MTSLHWFKHEHQTHNQASHPDLKSKPGYSASGFLLLQPNGEGPKRVPVSQPSQLAVVAPTQHQRVLGVSNGPQRIQRPVSHQKSATKVSVAVKSTHHADQNINPETQKGDSALKSKHTSQQSQPKTNAPKMNSEPAKPPSESTETEKTQSKPYLNLSKLMSLF